MTDVVHIEDDPLWAEFVRSNASQSDEIRFLGTAATGAEGLARCRELAPQIVILDLRLPDMPGLAVIARIETLGLSSRILLFTACADDALLAQLGSGRIAGLIWKQTNAGAELLLALRAIAAGGTHYSKEARLAWQRFTSSRKSYVNLLTATEIRMLPLFAQGFSDDEIAAQLGGKASTTHTHRKNIMEKLGLHTRTDLQKWAWQRGLIDLPRPAPPCVSPWTAPKAGPNSLP